MQVDVVVVEAADAVHLPRQHRGLSVDAGGLVLELDVQPGRLVVAELLGKRERQVDLLVQASDHQRHAVARAAVRAGAGCQRGSERGHGADREFLVHRIRPFKGGWVTGRGR
jgi:hypothetical protein